MAGLIDQLILTLVLIVLGNGKRLFGPLNKDCFLKLIETRSFSFGFVQLRYQVNPTNSSLSTSIPRVGMEKLS
jgi:dihydrofolate reductase